MKYKIVLVSFILVLKTATALWGQSACAPNLDFELGNFGNWHAFNGSVSDGPIFTFTPSPPIPGRETIMSGAGNDIYGLFPIVDPNGGSYSLKLGDSLNGAHAEKVRYYIRVPAGVNNYSLIYRYAVVFEDPGNDHLSGQKPTFQINVYDSISNKPIKCAQNTYVAGALPGFLVSTVKDYNGLYPYYKPWSTGSIDLSGLGGKTITLDVIASDCTLGAHFGYGYIDISCGLFAIDTKTCNRTYATLTAPPGFSGYTWYDSLTFTHVYGTAQVITTPMPGSLVTYAVILKPYPGFGCADTLYTHVFPSDLKIAASNDTFVCPKAGVKLLVTATDTKYAAPFTYSWIPATGLSCTTCDNPIASPVASTTYTVTVTNKAGCIKQEQVVVTTDQVTGVITKVDDSCFGASNGYATVSPITGIAPYRYIWSTLPPQTGIKATNLFRGTYAVTIIDDFGCSGVENVTITEPPANNITIAHSAGPTTCLGNDGYITLAGLITGTSYTLTYTEDGVPRSQTAIADIHGSIILRPLKAAVYDYITVDATLRPRPYCSFNVVGPLTLVDPPIPPIPTAGNNGPVCDGDTLKLNAKDAMPGVTFIWKGPSGFVMTGTDTGIAGVSFAQQGVYTVTAVKNLCSAVNTTTVKVKPHPVPVATGDTACSGSDIHLSASGSADAFRWAGPDAYSSFANSPVIHSCNVAADGVYTVTATLNGCTAIAYANVTIVATPPPPLIADVAYCQYDAHPLRLTATGSSITWYTADAKPFAGVPIPKTDIPGAYLWYADQRIAGPGTSGKLTCISERAAANVRIYAKQNATLIVSDTTVCENDDVMFTASSLGEDNDGITWDINGTSNSVKDVNPLHYKFAAGSYMVAATPLHKVCPNTTVSKIVQVYAYPLVELGRDTSICPGSTSIKVVDDVNKENTAAKWMWNTSETTPGITVTKPGVYNVNVLINGCLSTDTVTITNDCYMNLPNAFTPDGDGTNDYFLPREYLMKGLTGFKMDIYNRWGQVIYTTSSLTGSGWDGKYNNVLQPQGVFVYRVETSFKDGHVEHHTGNLTLLR